MNETCASERHDINSARAHGHAKARFDGGDLSAHGAIKSRFRTRTQEEEEEEEEDEAATEALRREQTDAHTHTPPHNRNHKFIKK